MSKKVILWSILSAMIVGGLSAATVGVLMSNNNSQNSVYTLSSGNTAAKDLYFTQQTQSASLPDLTGAAQMGVDAVVNIEILKRVQQRSFSGRGFDPFEFFFGPNYGQRGGGNNNQQQEESSEPNLQKMGGGSGVIISSDGYIVTNNHVIDGADQVKITLNSGDTYDGKVIGTDPSTDIALVKIDTKEPLSFLTFGNSDMLRLGEWVLAVGNPYGLNSTVTAGIVSAKGRSLGVSNSQLGIEAFIQTDAAVNPGNSGGALITTDGSLVGINTLIKSPTGSFTGYSFAVPSNIARKIVGDLREYGIVQRALLGVAMQEITSEWVEQLGEKNGIKEREGVFIAEVSKGSAAEAAGIKKGDVLLEVNSQKVSSPSTVQQTINNFSPGDKINISIKREGKVKHFDVTLRNRRGKEELMSSTDVDMTKELGGRLVEVSDKLKKELKIRGGAQVASVDPNGILAKARVRPGYIITSINDTPIYSLGDLNRITDKLEFIEGIYPDGRMASFQVVN